MSSGVLQSWRVSLLLPMWFVQIAHKARCQIFSDSNHSFIRQALKLARAGLKECGELGGGKGLFFPVTRSCFVSVCNS